MLASNSLASVPSSSATISGVSSNAFLITFDSSASAASASQPRLISTETRNASPRRRRLVHLVLTEQQILEIGMPDIDTLDLEKATGAVGVSHQ